MKCKIVTDSSSNLLSLEGIDFECVPLKIVTDKKEYADTSDLDVRAMAEEMLVYKGRSGTSCPNVSEWYEAFGDADMIFGVPITSNLSGSYAAAMQAKQDYEEEHPNAKVYIVDSLSAGPELVLMIERLKSQISIGKTFEEIKYDIQEYMKRTHLVFSLESLKNLANNGRVSHTVAKIAGILGIRLVGRASEHGTLEPLHKCRGEKNALIEILKEMKLNGFSGGKVRIAHCFNLEAAEKIANSIRSEYPECDIAVTQCTGLCCFYAEKGGLLVGYEG